jgi:hypothetical protein
MSYDGPPIQFRCAPAWSLSAFFLLMYPIAHLCFYA